MAQSGYYRRAWAHRSELMHRWSQILMTSRRARDCLLLHPDLPTHALFRCPGATSMSQAYMSTIYDADAFVLCQMSQLDLPFSTLIFPEPPAFSPAGGNGTVARVAVLQYKPPCVQGSRVLQILAILLCAARPGVHCQKGHGVLTHSMCMCCCQCLSRKGLLLAPDTPRLIT